MKTFICTLFLLAGSNLFGQLHMDSLGHIRYLTLHATMLNDVWGYVDEMGNEYGLIGAEKGTSIVSLTDPTNPTEIFWEPGQQSVWRDLKTWGDYAYVTTEAPSGLLIIDMSPLPSSTVLTTNYYTGPAGNAWQTAHNLYIDEYGYAYIFGSNRGNGGVIILDVNTDPMNPIEVGVFDNWYAHDGYVRNDTMYVAHISDGFMSVVNVTDRSNPVLLGTKATPSTFTHNVWLSNDGNYAFTTDELSGAYVAAYDVSDPANIVEMDRVQSSPGSGVIPHNTHVNGNYLVTSWYADGVVIHDATYPYNLIEVGNYRTYPQQTTNYDGCWGAYPFLPSGIVLATDRSEGLFVLGPQYNQAAYLEGTVTDAVTSLPIDQASIQILGTSVQESAGANGFYATGTTDGGTYNVYYDKVGYAAQTISTTLVDGVITLQDVQLTPLPPYNLTIRVFEEGTSVPVSNADIRMVVPQISHSGITNGLGQETFTLFYESMYNITVGKWGYLTVCMNTQIDNTTGTLDVYIRKGYYDDFTFDFGWAGSGTATTGLWERGEPFGTNGNAAPGLDVPDDCGDEAFVTGNLDNPYLDADDVDNGEVVLVSPVMDLTTYADPYVNYTQWFYCYHGPQIPDDTLFVEISNGLTNVVLDMTPPDLVNPPDSVRWEDRSFRITDFISPTSTMQFFFRVSDISPNVNITEAAIDHFYIAEAAELGLEETEAHLSLYPNPTGGKVRVTGLQSAETYRLLLPDGKILEEGTIGPDSDEVEMTGYQPGVYLLLVGDRVFRLIRAN